MPIRENVCHNSDCPQYGVVIEHYFRTTDPTPICECGTEMKLCISTFRTPFLGEISASKFNDPNCDKPDRGGFWVTRRKTRRDGSPIGVDHNGNELENDALETYEVRTWEERAAYCRDEGLIPQDEAGTLLSDEYGKVKSGRSGQPGVWGTWI